MKNFKLNLMYILNIIFGVLIYVFLSQSYIAIGEGRFQQNITGYDVIGNYFDGNSTEVMMALSNLLVAILAGVIILISIYGLLASMGIVKSGKAVKIVNFVNIVSSLILFAFAAIGLFCTLGETDSNVIVENVSKVGWANIVNMIIGLLMLIASILSYVFAKGTKKKKKK